MQIKEIEVKARITNPEELETKLVVLGCKLSKPITQKDTVYFPNGITVNNITPGLTFLRIREEKNKTILTLKKKTEISLSSIEKEVEIKNAKEMEEIILLLGYYKFNTLIKTRQKCKYHDYEICLDRIETLGDFIEVEKLSTQDTMKIQEELFKFLETLGINRSQRVTRGYDILLHQKLHPEEKE